MSSPDLTTSLTCKQVLAFLLAYLDDELAPQVRAPFERHLALCPACVAYLATYQQTVELVRGACNLDPQLVEALPDELVSAILASRP